MIENVLFVCIGNVCRSPFAEGSLKQFFKKNNISHQVSSAGIGALVGQPADALAVSLAAKKGYDLNKHLARQINKDMILKATIILVMEIEHIKHLHKQYPFSVGKVHLLGKWRSEEIIDPYKKPRAAFETMANHIDRSLKDWTLKFWSKKDS